MGLGGKFLAGAEELEEGAGFWEEDVAGRKDASVSGVTGKGKGDVEILQPWKRVRA